jgi:phosphate transport system permease protein
MGSPVPGDEPTPVVGEGPTRGTGMGGAPGPTSTTTAGGPGPGDLRSAGPARGRVKERRGDRVFRRGTLGSSVFLLVLLVAIALFLLARALPAINTDTTNFLTTKSWFPDAGPSVFGIAALTYGTVVTSVLAVAIAVPVAVGVALSVTQYVPRRFAQPIAYVVDLLAAVPSVVYGLWGLIFLVPAITPLSKWLSDYVGWIPIFTSDGIFGKSLFTASVVLAIMILPIIAAITREVFTLVPADHKEAAYALGASRWAMIRMTVLP